MQTAECYQVLDVECGPKVEHVQSMTYADDKASQLADVADLYELIIPKLMEYSDAPLHVSSMLELTRALVTS